MNILVCKKKKDICYVFVELLHLFFKKHYYWKNRSTRSLSSVNTHSLTCSFTEKFPPGCVSSLSAIQTRKRGRGDISPWLSMHAERYACPEIEMKSYV